MRKIKNYFTIYLYVFIIFTSMLPNKENTTKIGELRTILPGIDKIYSEENRKDNTEIKYSFKLFEIFQNIL